MPGKPQADVTDSPATSESEWEDVVLESRIVFDTIGDEYIGRFIGWSETDEKHIPQAHFESESGEQYFVNCGWSLKMQLKKVKVGTIVRIQYTGNQDTGQSTPMQLFRVQTKKR